ncbi:glycogen synthase GlgA [Geotalea sp. SG265]|uniref:glycogen synthase GlgA n=1 Tax=Geotalea sp. SG265 TaxID=2922867 RepID=UPI001FAFDAFF|nr:glycogen synthase GlgA [Geotalea sp. SG265]
MKILFVASEVTPFAKSGGLADVTGALPKSLKKQGHDVRIILPFYSEVERGGYGIRKGRKSVDVMVGGSAKRGLFRHTTLEDIPVYLLENKEYFSRDHLYGTASGEYPDNHQRFAFFCRGVLDLLKKMDYRPDIIHCHDWQTAMIPLILKKEKGDDLFFSKTGTVFTIHNLAYQGLFPREAMVDMGLDPSLFTIDCLEFYGKINLLKGAILTADVINTVSETYCREILTPEAGDGLDGVLALRRNDLYGVLNGIDYEHWNPATDRGISRNYTPAAPAGKAHNKKALQKRLGLEVAEDVPLIGMVSRLTEQKGFDLLEALLPRIAKAKLQLVLLGTGDEKYLKLLQEFAALGTDNISVNIGFHPELAPQIYAGSDIFLMPSRYEPCGLGQMIALRYGAVPVVRKTGGLADTVFDERDQSREPNGFSFDDYTPEALWEALSRAINAHADKASWKKMMKRGMAGDFSWNASARKYEELYRQVLAKKGR